MNEENNYINIRKILGDPSGWSIGEHEIKCPFCGYNYQHFCTPIMNDEDGDYQAWRGKGDLISILFKGECGHNWELRIGFHKGDSYIFVGPERHFDNLVVD